TADGLLHVPVMSAACETKTRRSLSSTEPEVSAEYAMIPRPRSFAASVSSDGYILPGSTRRRAADHTVPLSLELDPMMRNLLSIHATSQLPASSVAITGAARKHP